MLLLVVLEQLHTGTHTHTQQQQQQQQNIPVQHQYFFLIYFNTKKEKKRKKRRKKKIKIHERLKTNAFSVNNASQQANIFGINAFTRATVKRLWYK